MIAGYTRRDLIEEFARRNQIPDLDKAGNLVASMLDIMLELARDKGIRIYNFGVLKYKDRAAHLGRNVRTGEPVQVPATKVLSFKVTKHKRYKGDPPQ